LVGEVAEDVVAVELLELSRDCASELRSVVAEVCRPQARRRVEIGLPGVVEDIVSSLPADAG